jgi:hypothetical protein
MYVSLMERRGIEKGILREKTAMIREMLLSGEPEEKILRYARITRDQLDNIREQTKPPVN